MKLLILLAILTYSTSLVWCQSDSEKKVITGLQKIREENDLDPYLLKIEVNKYVKYFYEENLNQNKNSEDTLKFYLRSQHIYDYYLKTVEFSVQDIAQINDKYLSREEPQVYKLLLDDRYNLILLSVGNSKKEIDIKLVITQHLIDFEKVSESISFNPYCESCDREYHILLEGKSILPQVYYYSGKGPKNFDLEYYFTLGKDLEITGDSTFCLTLNHENQDIVFFDKEGNVVSHIVGH